MACDLENAELGVQPPRFPDRLPGEEPDRRLPRRLAANEQHFETPLRAQDLPDPFLLGGQAIVGCAARGSADPFEAGRHEPMVQDLLELPGDLLALSAQRRGDLEVLGGGRVARPLGGVNESEEAPVGRLAPVRVPRRLVRGDGGRRGGGDERRRRRPRGRTDAEREEREADRAAQRVHPSSQAHGFTHGRREFSRDAGKR